MKGLNFTAYASEARGKGRAADTKAWLPAGVETGSAPSGISEDPWRFVRITTLLCFISFASTAFVVAGISLMMGAVRLQILPEVASPNPPPSPRPQPPPPLPPITPGSMVIRQEAACYILVSGVHVSLVENGKCEDGGQGADHSTCLLGTDFPDCPLRLVPTETAGTT